uniref:Uncharacterized protein n=1 Tax=Leersia perrieri TaxID=77586 RepID=A0A0D9V620_9ORYZ
MMKPAPSSSSVAVRLLLLVASLQLLAVASTAVIVTPSETTTTAALPDEEFLARLCDQKQHGPTRRRLPWCQQLHARHHGRVYVPMPPPSRDGEEIDARFGVSKRLVPSGPNPLHN